MLPDNRQELKMLVLKISGMNCGHCAAAVTRALQKFEPGARVDVDLAAKTATIEARAEPAAIVQVLGAAGYPAVVQAQG